MRRFLLVDCLEIDIAIRYSYRFFSAHSIGRSNLGEGVHMGRRGKTPRQRQQQGPKRKAAGPNWDSSSTERDKREMVAGPEVEGVKLRPRPAPDESAVDLAVFSRKSRDLLPPELQREAELIVTALGLVFERLDASALASLQEIPRDSPYADWRLFIRGLVALYQDDSETARQNWRRLDAARRPARIAATLFLGATGETCGETLPVPLQDLADAGKAVLLRSSLLDAARNIARGNAVKAGQVFSTEQAEWLLKFRDLYRPVDAEFVDQFSHACIQLASQQGSLGAYETLRPRVAGPHYDPAWRLRNALNSAAAEIDEEEIVKLLNDYQMIDCPSIKKVPNSTVCALVSLVCQILSKHFQATPSGWGWGFLDDELESSEAEQFLQLAIDWYPRNREAHLDLIHLLETQVDQRGRGMEAKSERRDQLAQARRTFVQFFSDDVTTVLLVIDDYLAQDKPQLAQELAATLRGSRWEDPRVQALDWRILIRKASFLSRRKAGLAAAREALAEAEAIWPVWLSRDFLPFLQAALVLRAGDPIRFELLQKAARDNCHAFPLLGDIMLFAALQLMHVPGAELKPWRENIELWKGRSTQIQAADLCRIGAFLGDLQEAGIQHSAYRPQSRAFGPTLVRSLKVPSLRQLDCYEKAFRWAATHRFWSGGRYSIVLMDDIPLSSPRLAAAYLEMLVRDYADYPGLKKNATPLMKLLETTINLEPNPVDRFQFERVLQQARDQIAKQNQSAEFMGGFFNRFAELFGGHGGDNEPNEEYIDEEDIDDGEFDSECDCPRCQAARRRPARAPGTQSSGGELDLDDFFASDVFEGMLRETEPSNEFVLDEFALDEGQRAFRTATAQFDLALPSEISAEEVRAARKARQNSLNKRRGKRR